MGFCMNPLPVGRGAEGAFCWAVEAHAISSGLVHDAQPPRNRRQRAKHHFIEICQEREKSGTGPQQPVLSSWRMIRRNVDLHIVRDDV